MGIPGPDHVPAQPRDHRPDAGGVAGRAGAAGRRGRPPDVSVACGHGVRVRRACVLLRHQRQSRGDIPVGQDARRSRMDREGLRRRRAVVQSDPYRHLRRTVRVHVGDRAPVAVRHRRPAVLGDGRGSGEPGLLSRPRGAGAEFRARACGAGGVRIGRASRPRRDQQRARSRGGAHRRGRVADRGRGCARVHEPARSRRPEHGSCRHRVDHRGKTTRPSFRRSR